MAFFSIAIGVLVAGQAPPAAAADRWWECYYFLPPVAGRPGSSGRLVRFFTFEGRPRSGLYELWGSGMRVSAQALGTPQGPRFRVSSLSIEIPATGSRGGGAIYGYLLGDDRLIATTTLLDTDGARRGHFATSASFHGAGSPEIGAPLATADRWTLVVAHADGTEVLRRDLPVPDHGRREAAFARHWAALDAAWDARDPNLLVSTPADSLPQDRGNCLLSTPEAREDMENSSIFPLSG